MFAPQRPFVTVLAVIAHLLGASACLAQDKDEDDVKWDVTSDLDGDGMLDRASIVHAPDGGTSDLHIFLGASSTKTGDDAAPDIIKKAIVHGTVLAFESREKATLTLMSCTGCTSISALEQTLTVVYRNRTFMIGRYTRGWELTTRFANGEVDVLMGGCSIDFLTGEGRVSEGLEDAKPVKERFKPIALASWSDTIRPAICKYKREK